VSDPIPTLREYGHYLESLERPLDVDAIVAAAGSGDLGALMGAETTVADLDPVRGEGNRRRRWPVAAAAAVVAAALLIAATVLLEQSGDDHIRTKPAEPAPTTVLTPPDTGPGNIDTSKLGALVVVGDPSSPPTGELVAAVTLYHKGAYRLYADGRLLSLLEDRTLLENGSLIDDNVVWPPWFEQRLTPEGVERVRLLFLSSPLFEPAQPPGEGPQCTLGFQVCVRDGDHMLVAEVNPAWAPAPPFGDSPPDAVALFDYLDSLDSSLPATEWEDRELRTYVAARIEVCLSTYANQAQVPLDLSVVLPRFSEPAAALLGGREPNAKKTTGTLIGPYTIGDSCFEMTHDEARALVDALLAPSGGGSHEHSGIVVRFDGETGATPPDEAFVYFGQLLPEGSTADYHPG
jgi:hypothetical protein